MIVLWLCENRVVFWTFCVAFSDLLFWLSNCVVSEHIKDSLNSRKSHGE